MCPTPGGGILHQIFGSPVQHAKKLTLSDLRFGENEESRFKINEIGGQLDRKLRIKLIQMSLNLLNNTFW